MISLLGYYDKDKLYKVGKYFLKHNEIHTAGIYFGLFYGQYWVIFPVENSKLFPNPQEKIHNRKLQHEKFE